MNNKIALCMMLLFINYGNVLSSESQQKSITHIDDIEIEEYRPPITIEQIAGETDIIISNDHNESFQIPLWQRVGIYLITCYFTCQDYWQDRIKPVIIRLIKKKKQVKRQIRRRNIETK